MKNGKKISTISCVLAGIIGSSTVYADEITPWEEPHTTSSNNVVPMIVTAIIVVILMIISIIALKKIGKNHKD